MQNLFSTTQGQYLLKRYPAISKDPLRAWDAGDELMVNYLQSELTQSLDKSAKVLIINDQFGALCSALHAFNPTLYTDSYIAQQATQANLQHNHLGNLRIINSMQPLVGTYDLVIIKIQKSLAHLEDQLHKLRAHVTPGTKIIGAAMVKMLHTSNLSLFEKIIGPTSTSLAKKKARLIFSQFSEDLMVKPNPYPETYILDKNNWPILNHANVFSRAKLDLGCRFFIDHLPSSQSARDIVDLGCGNGLVGLMAAKLNPNAQLYFTDESFMAVASAKENFSHIFGDSTKATFHVDDCLSSKSANSADLILNNPPFHQQNAIGDFIALQMFNQAYQTLRTNGELWVIGNRHLDYKKKLGNIFKNCVQVTSNGKFVILRAIKKI